MNTEGQSLTRKAGSGARVRLVIPAYRESGRLPQFAAALIERLAEFGGAVELLVVDDGSGPDEAGKLAELIGEWRGLRPWVRPLLALETNKGKGAAVYAGWEPEHGEGAPPEWLGFCDADGSVDADETVRLICFLDTLPVEAGALIASRRIGGQKCEGRSVARALAAAIFSIWVRCWTGLKARDTQCGCKFVRTDAYRRIKGGLTLRRFAFDVELLARINGRGLIVVEEAVKWRHVKGGSLRVWRDGPAMLAAVAALGSRRGR